MNVLNKIQVKYNKIRNNISLSKIEFLRYRYIKIYLIVCSVINVSLWIFAFLIKNSIKEGLAILHYSIDFGPDLLGGSDMILIIPLFGLVIIMLNVMLLFVFDRFDKFEIVAHLLLFTANLINFLLVMALFFIYLINFKS